MLGRSFVAFLRWAFLALVVVIAFAWHTLLLIHRGADVAGAAQFLLGDHRWWPWHWEAFLLVRCFAFRDVVLLHHSVIVPDADFFCCICALSSSYSSGSYLVFCVQTFLIVGLQ